MALACSLAWDTYPDDVILDGNKTRDNLKKMSNCKGCKYNCTIINVNI